MRPQKRIPKQFYLLLAAILFMLAAIIFLSQQRKEGTGQELKTSSEQNQLDTDSAEESRESGFHLEDQEKEVQGSSEIEMPNRKNSQRNLQVTPDAGENLGGGFKGELVEATGEGAGLNFDDYYWGKKRYTEYTVGYLTENMQWRTFVGLKNNESMHETMEVNYGPERLLDSYLEQHALTADTATVLLDRYGGSSGGREEYYVQFNDEAETLVTVVYYRATNQHSSYMDVLPCQYTKEEIGRLKKMLEGEKSK